MIFVRQAFITDNLEVIAGYRDSKDKVGKWADQLKADFGDHEIYTAWGFCGLGFRGEPLPGWKRNRHWKRQEIYYPDKRTKAGKEAYAKLQANKFPGWAEWKIPGMPPEVHSPHPDKAAHKIHWATAHDLGDHLLCAWNTDAKVKHDERWRPLKLSEYYALVEALEAEPAAAGGGR